ncbi:unnamed protein product [Spirodela intermedia]|uniref:Reverse transcriptase domain-containing protein n=1 Tax=Spirodela intermedia TaxID=51605 RepID=A0A7I8JI17_SPIIN|nr:unnamed protein product [Spirodela intermedia]CAA6669788.1 unnamed protein product [Spirodela intermedia]
MESLEADLEALKEDKRGTKKCYNKQPEPHPLQNPEQREGIYKPNCQTELPNFTGDNPNGWLPWAERYFRINQMPKHDRLEAPLEHCSQAEGIFTAHVSLNSVMGLTQHGTMKVKGIMQDKQVTILIDTVLNKTTISFKAIECELKRSHICPLELHQLLGTTLDFIDHASNLLPCTQHINLHPYSKKRDDSWRFYIDYRALNKFTIPNMFLLPIVDELLEELHGMSFYIQKTVFKTHEGHYKFKVMPFGLSNARTTVQYLMNDIFRLYLWKFVLIFFDDILVFSKTHQEHDEHLDNVFFILAANSLYVNEKNNLKALQRFLGVTGYYHRFVKCYATLSWPLTRFLALPNFSQNFLVETYALGHSIGAEGKKNAVVNALSRAPQLGEAVVAPMCIAQGVDVTTINKEVEDDSQLSKIKITNRRLNFFSTLLNSTRVTSLQRLTGLLQPLPIPNMIWEDLSMNFIESLPKFKGYDSILVILHGIPRSIVTHRGTVFTTVYGWALPHLHYGSPMSPTNAVDTYLKERDDDIKIRTSQLHNYSPIFLISQLRKALGNSAYCQPIPSILTDALEWNVTPKISSPFEIPLLTQKSWSNGLISLILKLRGNYSWGEFEKAPRTYNRRKKAQSPMSQ